MGDGGGGHFRGRKEEAIAEAEECTLLSGCIIQDPIWRQLDEL